MINTNISYDNMFNSVAREFVGRVELLEGSTLVQIFEHDGALVSFTIDKAGDSTKFFGYGICQKATVKLRDKERAIEIKKGQCLQIAHGIGKDYVYTYPIFYVDEVSRDENTNELTIIAYDAIYKASGLKVKDLKLPETYRLNEFAAACAGAIGMSIAFENIGSPMVLDINYDSTNANFTGEESVRDALNSLAEVFAAIYYINNDWELTFKGFNANEPVAASIDKSKYFDLTVKTAHSLQNVVSVTDLSDNLTASSGREGATQYIRENPFLTLLSTTLIGWAVEECLSRWKDIVLYQFDCKHRGDFRIEIGDKISLTTKDNETIYTYVLNDSITYNGGLIGQASWEYTASEGETDSNPSSVGEVVRQTYAKVDKVANRIDLVASNIDENTENISQLSLQANGLSASVEQVQSSLTASMDSMNTNINNIAQRVSAGMTPEDVNIAIETTLTSGVDSITTRTGYKFDSEGLTISKTGSEMNTQITEDGMTVYRGSEPMLVADHIGVEAVNLYATTYLIIGTNSRLENYNGSRTGCFWIGE